jgi:hypothetical protein
VRETTASLCPQCGKAVETTCLTDRVGDHRITVHVHPEPDADERCRYDAGPETGAVALDTFPGDT